MIIETFER